MLVHTNLGSASAYEKLKFAYERHYQSFAFVAGLAIKAYESLEPMRKPDETF